MRGTTPTITINTAIDLTGADVVYVTFRQKDCNVIEKEKESLEITENLVEFKLEQSETIKLDKGHWVDFQIRARFPDGTAVKSNIMKANVTDILKEGVI